MPEREQKTAQKGFILDPERNHLLTIRYKHAPFMPKLDGKYGLPGGQIDFGEKPDDALKREIIEETGIITVISIPFYIFTWTYQKEHVYI
jgi:8-oxo-dGTP pyrophosphatase MutT (NUDIX family)